MIAKIDYWIQMMLWSLLALILLSSLLIDLVALVYAMFFLAFMGLYQIISAILQFRMDWKRILHLIFSAFSLALLFSKGFHKLEIPFIMFLVLVMLLGLFYTYISWQQMKVDESI